MKFHFKLQTILNLKKSLEKQKKAELGIANQQVIEEKEKMNLLQDKRLSYEGLFKKKANDKLALKEIKRYYESLNFYKVQMKDQNEKIISSKEIVEIKTNELKEALMQKNIYKKLKENSYLEYAKENLKEEQKHLDEIVSYKYNI